MKHKRPNGEWTDDPEVAFSEWDLLAKPFVDLGFIVIGYDPGISMYDPQRANSCFELPTYAAQRISAALPPNLELTGRATQAEK